MCWEKSDHVNITVIILTLYLSISLVFKIICNEILLYSCFECLQYLMSFIKLKSKMMNPIEHYCKYNCVIVSAHSSY